jgi:crossover junction endodeoxyribonuclease RuvC
MTLWIGIDPGLGGAVGILKPDAPAEFFDTPTVSVKVGKGSRRAYELTAIVDFLVRLPVDELADVRAVLEKVHAMPGQGVTSMFSMGYGFGIWEMALAALGIPYKLVTPQRWKAAMIEGADRGKNAARLTAIKMFPHLADDLKFKVNADRAEALLMAAYCKQVWS